MATVERESPATETKDYPCVTCHTNCCKAYTVFINAHDIHRICDGLKIPPQSFLELYDAKDKAWGVKLREGLCDIALKRKDDRCIFLVEAGEFFRCGIHEFKPGICKAYPFDLRKGKLVQRAQKLCPVDWEMPREFEEMIIEHLKDNIEEWDFYYGLIEEWNSMNGPAKSFASFLEFAIERVVASTGRQFSQE